MRHRYLPFPKVYAVISHRPLRLSLSLSLSLSLTVYFLDLPNFCSRSEWLCLHLCNIAFLAKTSRQQGWFRRIFVLSRGGCVNLIQRNSESVRDCTIVLLGSIRDCTIVLLGSIRDCTIVLLGSLRDCTIVLLGSLRDCTIVLLIYTWLYYCAAWISTWLYYCAADLYVTVLLCCLDLYVTVLLCCLDLYVTVLLCCLDLYVTVLLCCLDLYVTVLLCCLDLYVTVLLCCWSIRDCTIVLLGSTRDCTIVLLGSLRDCTIVLLGSLRDCTIVLLGSLRDCTIVLLIYTWLYYCAAWISTWLYYCAAWISTWLYYCAADLYVTVLLCCWSIRDCTIVLLIIAICLPLCMHFVLDALRGPIRHQAIVWFLAFFSAEHKCPNFFRRAWPICPHQTSGLLRHIISGMMYPVVSCLWMPRPNTWVSVLLHVHASVLPCSGWIKHCVDVGYGLCHKVCPFVFKCLPSLGAKLLQNFSVSDEAGRWNVRRNDSTNFFSVLESSMWPDVCGCGLTLFSFRCRHDFPTLRFVLLPNQGEQTSLQTARWGATFAYLILLPLS